MGKGLMASRMPRQESSGMSFSPTSCLVSCLEWRSFVKGLLCARYYPRHFNLHVIIPFDRAFGS